MTDTFSNISQPDIQSLEKLYSLEGRTEVLQFLDKHSFLMTVVLDSPNNIYHYFPKSHLCLEMFIDPENNDSVQLVLSIKVKLDRYDAGVKLRQLDRDWFKTLSSQVHDLFFTVIENPDDF
ncbi:MAG: hypothetical protein V7L25_16210 [Nostoc sp.]|uniref:hypothetical protein n=1 Tax=Nostoc sp. TaxID=1180 RepID=UPI002FEE8139